MYEPILEKIGINSSEAIAYEAMVSLGKATPAQVAKITKLSRVNTYQILPKLETLGLIQRISDSKNLEYTITSPDILFDLLEKQQNEISETKNLFKNIIKQLEPRINISHNHPVIKYFRGTEGAKEAYMGFLEGIKEKKIYGILNRSDDKGFVELMEKVFVSERMKKNISLDLIVTDKQSNDRFIKDGKKDKRNVKLIESNGFPSGTYILFESNTTIIVTKQPEESRSIGILIDHQDITKTIKSMFDLLWE